MSGVKVFLDDEREAPDGWFRCYWPNEVIRLLDLQIVEELSLDHDLGDTQVDGYTVLQWLEEAVVTRGIRPPRRIVIHSANPSVYKKMSDAIDSIKRLYEDGI